MKLLVLGGTGFVGRTVVEEALSRGWTVATLNRGTRPAVDARVRQLVGDRLAPSGLDAAAAEPWDVVVDTWSGAPRVVQEAARALALRSARYVYVSSCSVYGYPPPVGPDEDAPTVKAAADAGDGGYAANKRGAELAVAEAFGDRALLARAGLILGPHEDVGRLPWWLLRIERGGDVLAPGPPDLALQHVDARDLAGWMLDAASRGLSGPFNTVGRPGQATMRDLIEGCRRTTGSHATLRWTAPAAIEAAGIEAWSELPIWIPEGHEARGLHEVDVSRAHAAGLACRPLQETIDDTWAWLVAQGRRPPQRPDREAPGLDAERERAALASRAGR
jgi:nucleoside-diphosphate-sugar epimerase